MSNKKFNFYKCMYVILVLIGCIGFFLPWFIIQRSNNPENSTTLLTNLAGYLRFLTGNRSQMIIDIAIHNTAIAILGLILSFFSRGTLGTIALFLNLFMLGVVLHDIHTLPIIIFAGLEFLGICVAVFGGTMLSEKNVKCNMPFKRILKYLIILATIIATLYFIAAFVETNAILNK